MLSVAKLAPGREAYYEASVARGLDDYHAGRGEAPGVWAGAGAELLGLFGRVEHGQLGELISGVDPASGVRLRRHYPPRDIRVVRLDPDTGRRVASTRRLEPVGGFDLVFSVPKSASVLWALGDPRVRREVEAAHEAAWRSAVGYLEREACATRSGRNGVERERGEGFVAAAFTHRTSRALDPHLHTHVIVANLTRSGRDGRWRTLEGDALLRSYRLAAGYLYEAHVRYELTSRLGVDWGEPSKGMGEIRGVSASVLRHFSTRRQQIEQHLADHGSGGWRAAQVAAIITRDTKTSADLESLRSNWRAQAAEHGLTPGDLEHILGRARWQAMDHREQRATTRQLLSPRGLTEKDTTFSSAELVRAWAEAHRNGAQADTVLALVDQLARTPGVVHVADAAPGVPARLSTRDLIDAELAVLNAAKRGIHAGAPRAGVVDLMRATQAARVELGADQQAMIEHVTRSEDRIVCVVGHAGAGKTTALRVCADAFTQRGCVVLGAAPSGIAAQKLGQETGLRATTLHGLVADADLESGLPRGAVVIVDEASTADTRTLARLISHVDQARGKLVLVGDAAQLPSVGAGGLFAELVDRLGAVELASNRRQHHPTERVALARLRGGESEPYLAWAIQHQRLVITPTVDEARDRLVNAWWETAQTDPASDLMLAYRREDVAALNHAARRLMRRTGRLAAFELETPNGSIAAGDRIVCRRNDTLAGVRNGTRGTVTAVDPVYRTIHVRTDAGAHATLPARYVDAGQVEHGYATTGHQAQGLTLVRAHVLVRPDGDLREWGYVTTSRAAGETRLYVANDEHGADRAAVLERAVRALERSAAEHLATRHGLERDRGIEIGM